MNSHGDRLDRIERAIESLVGISTVQQDILDALTRGAREMQESMVQTQAEIRDIKVEMRQMQAEIRDIRVDIREMQTEIRGLQAENRRILDYLFNQQSEGNGADS
ncbi:MAG: hypothetical protein HC890_04525 [Chloroflexaceae bacterium]|nr:hypothetical protein [Chloroflexaceae bacterium]